MYKMILVIGMLFLPLLGQTLPSSPETLLPISAPNDGQALYHEMHLEGKVNPVAFLYAVKGYERITERKKDILTLIDFSKPSNQKRLFVFDMHNKTMIYSSVVAHGKNSGEMMATHFSNREGSHKSSLGFYLTDHTYQGKNGYSLILDGLEEGINSNARRRAIVIHGARYANPSVLKNGGRLGRSFGCPALPQNINQPIIDAIKDGSVLYIYSEDKNYLTQSTILNTKASTVL